VRLVRRGARFTHQPVSKLAPGAAAAGWIVARRGITGAPRCTTPHRTAPLHRAADMTSALPTEAVDLAYSVRVTNFEAGDAYQLRLFSSSPDSHPNAHEPHPVAFCAADSGQLAVRYLYSGGPGFLHAWLFVTKLDAKLGVPLACLAGWGRVYFDSIGKTPVRADIVDVRGDTQAVLTVRTAAGARTDRPPRCLLSAEQIGDEHSALYEQMQTQIRSVYARLREAYRPPVPDHSNFYFVETHMQKMPITTFAYLSTFVANTDAQIEALLEGLARCVDAGVSTTIGEQLVDVCTSLPRALVYTNDATRTGHNGRATVDLWSQLSMYPDINAAGFDCEDGAGLVMSIVYCLRNCVLSSAASPLLRALQRHATRLTPFFTLGNLKSGPGARDFVSHAYVTMLDSRWVDAQLDPTLGAPSDPCPALSLESTAYVSGEWGPGAAGRRPIVSHLAPVRKALRAAFAGRDAADLLRAVRLFTPTEASNATVSVYNDRGDVHKGTYQDVYVLMAVDHRPNRVVHAIVTGDGTIGALAEKLLTYDRRVKLHTVIDQTRSEFSDTYQCLWKQDPKNTLPQPPLPRTRGPAPAAPDGAVAVLDLPMRVWEANAAAYESALDSFCADSGYRVDHGEPARRLAGDIALKRVYVVLGAAH
jgi:hypothetical protein